MLRHGRLRSVGIARTTSVTATFIPAPKTRFTLSVTVSGNGSVVSSPAGIACPGTCSATYDQGTQVTLAPIAGAGAVFVSWGGACSGAGVCVVTINADASAVGDLQRPPHAAARDPARAGHGQARPRDIGAPVQARAAVHVLPGQRPLARPAVPRHAEAPDRPGGARFLRCETEGRRVPRRRRPERAAERRVPDTARPGLLPDLPEAAALGPGAGVLARPARELERRDGRGADPRLERVRREPRRRHRRRVPQRSLPGSARPAAGEPPSSRPSRMRSRAARRARDVALNVLQSKEARTKLIQGLFQSLLGRPATQAEIDALVTRGEPGDLASRDPRRPTSTSRMAAKYEASIHWGDGSTSPGTVQQNGDRCTVVGTHGYSSDGRRTLMVDVTSPDGNETTADPPADDHAAAPATAGQGERPALGQGLHQEGRQVRAADGLCPGAARDGARHAEGQGQAHLARRLDRRLLRGDLQARRREGTADDLHRDHSHRRELRRLPGVQANALGRREAEAASKSIRHVWGNAKGHFRTKGKYASATIRGTLWLTNDVCGGTWVHVRRGIVDVFDFVKRKHVFTRAGHSYLAKPKSA